MMAERACMQYKGAYKANVIFLIHILESKPSMGHTQQSLTFPKMAMPVI